MERRLAGLVGRSGVGAEVMVERDVLLEDHDEVLDRRRRRGRVRSASASVAAVREGADRADAREHRSGKHDHAEHPSGESHSPSWLETDAPGADRTESRRAGGYEIAAPPRVTKS